MSNIAIILARGGSKRLPKKNILDFCGKPMIAWTIQAALKSERFDGVLVSTDSDEIAKIAISFGAEVPFLRKDSSDDFATSTEATLSALNQAEKYWNESFDNVTQLMANCPLRDDKDIQKMIDCYAQSNSPSQISSFKFGWMNPWWAAKLDNSNRPEQIFKESATQRSQDLEDLYCPTGALWIAKSSELKKYKTYYLPNHTFSPIPWISALDIDDNEDLEMGRACFIIKNN